MNVYFFLYDKVKKVGCICGGVAMRRLAFTWSRGSYHPVTQSRSQYRSVGRLHAVCV